ncbi:rod shape-determining protein MreC [Rhizosphaericola mali]|uniref:Cell shape-determining protein MreC n=1 Tax=Rhizosphaericola mali TaxID=2545455 RepID=A0A5P2G330_9BACT|nr:rod shape-determining protein MreC [Rhizosphaericola mali]
MQKESSLRNIIIFIRRYITFFTFLVMEIICISIMVRYNQTYRATYANISNDVTGFFMNKYNNVEYYFQLRKTNRQLADENAYLKNFIITSLGKNGDTSTTKLLTRIDSLYRDTLGRNTKFIYSVAKVVNNSTTNENNYITIQKGSKDGVTTDMAVDGPDGIVGHVVAVSKNFSIIMSLLNHNSRVSVMIKGKPFTGVVDWDGKNIRELTLHNVPKTIKLHKNDSIITSNLSENFPPGLLVGRVDRIILDKSSSLMDVQVTTGTNFNLLQYVYLIKNTLYTEQKVLEQSTLQAQPVKK